MPKLAIMSSGPDRLVDILFQGQHVLIQESIRRYLCGRATGYISETANPAARAGPAGSIGRGQQHIDSGKAPRKFRIAKPFEAPAVVPQNAFSWLGRPDDARRDFRQAFGRPVTQAFGLKQRHHLAAPNPVQAALCSGPNRAFTIDQQRLDEIVRQPARHVEYLELVFLESIQPFANRSRPDGSIRLLDQAFYVRLRQVPRDSVAPPLIGFLAQNEIIARADPNSSRLVFEQAVGIGQQRLDARVLEPLKTILQTAENSHAGNTRPHHTMSIL